jgi:hypothetical protein
MTNKKRYIAATRAGTRQISAHLPEDVVKAFRIDAAKQDKDVQQLLAEAVNLPIRAPVTSGKRTRSHAATPK